MEEYILIIQQKLKLPKFICTFFSLLATVPSATWSRVLAGMTPNSSDAKMRKSSFLPKFEESVVHSH